MPRTPDYQRIAHDLRTQITSGTLKFGDRLPSISQLQRMYDVAAQPVKSALLVICTEGLVEGHRGRGIFVTYQRPGPGVRFPRHRAPRRLGPTRADRRSGQPPVQDPGEE
jgi:DNA-binding GntR family transcriptional regulator